MYICHVSTGSKYGNMLTTVRTFKLLKALRKRTSKTEKKSTEAFLIKKDCYKICVANLEMSRGNENVF